MAVLGRTGECSCMRRTLGTSVVTVEVCRRKNTGVVGCKEESCKEEGSLHWGRQKTGEWGLLKRCAGVLAYKPGGQPPPDAHRSADEPADCDLIAPVGECYCTAIQSTPFRFKPLHSPGSTSSFETRALATPTCPSGSRPADCVYPNNPNCSIPLYRRIQKCVVARVCPKFQKDMYHACLTLYSTVNHTATTTNAHQLVPCVQAPSLLFPSLFPEEGCSASCTHVHCVT